MAINVDAADARVNAAEADDADKSDGLAHDDVPVTDAPRDGGAASDGEGEAGAGSEGDVERASKSRPPRRTVLALLAVVAAMAAVVAWQGLQAYRSHQADASRELFVQVARQAAVNLTTIDYQQAEADISRVLDSATGSLYDDFAKRSEPFVQLVKQAKSRSVGAVTEAGLESATDTEAQILVAVSVKTSNAAAPEQTPRAWRMRISVQKVGDQVKASKVDFVP